MPAAAVIPAPIVYAKAAAVEALVVVRRGPGSVPPSRRGVPLGRRGPPRGEHCAAAPSSLGGPGCS